MGASPAQLILDQCDRLRKLMKEIPGNAPDFSKLNNWIVEVENLVKTDVEAANWKTTDCGHIAAESSLD